MNKRLMIGSLVGMVALYAVGYVIWEMVFADFFAANAGSATGVAKDPQLIWAVALGSLLYAALITLMLESKGATSPVDALKVGAVVGLLLWGTTDFIMFGYFNLNNLTATIADVVLEGVRGGIAGAIIAVVLAKAGS